MNLINLFKEKFFQYKKAVIMGNGPSINDYKWDNFKERQDTIFLTCNRVSFLFEKTTWRPDIFSCFAKPSLENKDWIQNVEECLSDDKIFSFIDKRFKTVSNIKNFHKNCYFVDKITEHSRHHPIKAGFIDHDLEECFVKSYSATATLFQICDNLNIEEICIIGQDGYNLKKGKNHFDSKYLDEASNFKKSNDRIFSMHKELNRYFSKKKVKVYNSSQNSILNSVYEFKDLTLFVK